MPDISVGRSIGPVAQIGRPLRAEVLRRTGAHPQERIVMVSLGGMDVRLPIESWSNTEGLHFIVPRAWEATGDRISAFEDLALPFADVMASCDALIAKPGYGSFVEAACLGIPVLYVDRPNWPEVPYVVRWLEQHGRCKRLGPEQVTSGPSRDALDTLLNGRQDPVRPNGVQEATDYIVSLLM